MAASSDRERGSERERGGEGSGPGTGTGAGVGSGGARGASSSSPPASMSASPEHCRRACTGKDFVEANCPVSGHLVDATGVHADTPQVVLKNGQRVYLCSSECVERLKSEMKRYTIAPGDRFVEQPDMFGQHMSCPECKAGTSFLVKEDTPRIMFRHGQTIYFSGYGCLNNFLRSPSYAASGFASLVMSESRAVGLTAMCPVVGKKIAVDDKAHMIEFKHGQRIYTCGAQCPLTLMRNIHGFIRHPTEHFVHPAQPSLGGLTQMCVTCAHAFTIDEDLTPRVQFKGGQQLYFHTNACADEFMGMPEKFVKPLPTEVVSESYAGPIERSGIVGGGSREQPIPASFSDKPPYQAQDKGTAPPGATKPHVGFAQPAAQTVTPSVGSLRGEHDREAEPRSKPSPSTATAPAPPPPTSALGTAQHKSPHK